MGNNSNSQSLNQQESQTHQRLGLIRIFQKQNNSLQQQQTEYFVQLKRNLPNQKAYEKWLNELKQIQSQQARDVIYLPLSYKYQQTAMCGSSGHAKIKNRRKMMQYFQQTELWYLLYNLVQSGTIFQKNNKKLGDLNSNNCLLNEIGQMKILATCSMPGETSNYQKIIESTTNDVYLGIYPKIDLKKAQVYNIGMILLQAASLQDCFYVYNRGPYKINQNKMKDYIKIIEGKYSQQFNQYLKNMLQQQPSKRRNSSEIFCSLYPYESQILDLRPFSFIRNHQEDNEETYNQNQNKDKIFQTANIGLNSYASPFKNFGLGLDSNNSPVKDQNSYNNNRPYDNLALNSFNKPLDNLALNSYQKPMDNLAINSFNKPFQNLALDSYAKPNNKINMNNPQRWNNQLNPNSQSHNQRNQKKQLSGIKSQNQNSVQPNPPQTYRRQFL